ncbi:hypothetical protein PanWU01x14_036480, partial [Parasponia andersonii]
CDRDWSMFGGHRILFQSTPLGFHSKSSHIDVALKTIETQTRRFKLAPDRFSQTYPYSLNIVIQSRIRLDLIFC